MLEFNMFCLLISYKKPETLHSAHPCIKSLDFVLGNCHTTNINAHKKAVKYINHYFGTINDPVAFVDRVPSTPTCQKEWDAIPTGYFCTESPTEWKLSVWKKIKNTGFVYNSFQIKEIFSITILQVHKICLDSPVKKWLAFSAGLEQPSSINDAVSYESEIEREIPQFELSDSEKSVSESND